MSKELLVERLKKVIFFKRFMLFCFIADVFLIVTNATFAKVTGLVFEVPVFLICVGLVYLSMFLMYRKEYRKLKESIEVC